MTLFLWGIVVLVVVAVSPIIGEVIFRTGVLPWLLYFTVPGAVIALAMWVVGHAIYWWLSRSGGGV